MNIQYIWRILRSRDLAFARVFRCHFDYGEGPGDEVGVCPDRTQIKAETSNCIFKRFLWKIIKQRGRIYQSHIQSPRSPRSAVDHRQVELWGNGILNTINLAFRSLPLPFIATRTANQKVIYLIHSSRV